MRRFGCLFASFCLVTGVIALGAEPAVHVNLIDTKKYYDASRPYRLDAINGKLNSGDVVDEERSKDRTSY